MKLVSWNINGLRSAVRTGFLQWLESAAPDVVSLQEVKAFPGDVPPAVREPDGYASVWRPALRPGYSGVLTYFRRNREPLNVFDLGAPAFDVEGRAQVLEFKAFTLINAYFPNSQPLRARLPYKLSFCRAILRYCNKLRKAGRHVVVCGDYNISHKDIDLARPKANRNNPGFYPEECAFLDRFARAGYVDAFRLFTTEGGHYSWWSMRTAARERNIGWRLDYHWTNREFAERIAEAKIHPNVYGSDHCPVSLTVKE